MKGINWDYTIIDCKMERIFEKYKIIITIIIYIKDVYYFRWFFRKSIHLIIIIYWKTSWIRTVLRGCPQGVGVVPFGCPPRCGCPFQSVRLRECDVELRFITLHKIRVAITNFKVTGLHRVYCHHQLLLTPQLSNRSQPRSKPGWPVGQGRKYWTSGAGDDRDRNGGDIAESQ